MTLLELAEGKASLELRPFEVSGAMASLSRFGKVSVERHPTHALVRLDDHDFVFMDEWDEPCLISGDAAGTSILAQVAAFSEAAQRSAR